MFFSLHLPADLLPIYLSLNELQSISLPSGFAGWCSQSQLWQNKLLRKAESFSLEYVCEYCYYLALNLSPEMPEIFLMVHTHFADSFSLLSLKYLSSRILLGWGPWFFFFGIVTNRKRLHHTHQTEWEKRGDFILIWGTNRFKNLPKAIQKVCIIWSENWKQIFFQGFDHRMSFIIPICCIFTLKYITSRTGKTSLQRIFIRTVPIQPTSHLWASPDFLL